MRRQPPIVRCFGALCLISAVTLVALEWRNPFPDPVATPQSLTGAKQATLEPGTSAQAAELASANSEPADRGFWNRPKRTKMPLQSPVRLSLSLEGRYLEVSLPAQPAIRYDVAIGQDNWQTPTGSFTVMNKLENPAWLHPITKETIPPGPDNPLGDRWIGFWSNGEAQIGFHGTNQEELIGEAVSHGCVRMRNEDIKELYELIEVGTPVTVTL